MEPTQYEDINSLIKLLLSHIKDILGEKLVGFYLYGSLVLGDFDHDVSDIDLVAALSSDMTDAEFETLQIMHNKFAQEHKEWEDRIEVCYITIDALASVKSKTSMVANISPGEPFHRRESNIEWIMDWYILREKSITLFGPPAKSIIEPISKDEFVQGIKAHISSWRKYVDDMHKRKGQAYSILTMCRALYAIKHDEQVSKKQAAELAMKKLPEWSGLIQNAIEWREAKDESQVNHEETFSETKKFVLFVVDQIEEFNIKPLEDSDKEWIKDLLTEQYGSSKIVTKGKVWDSLNLPGFKSVSSNKNVGLITYNIEDRECEIITLNSLIEGKGIGSQLIDEVIKTAKDNNCRRVWLITLNDNLHALDFYKKRGFTIKAVHKNALEESRKLKPEIPLVGMNGIPLTDEIELEMKLN